MIQTPDSKYRVPDNGSFVLADSPTKPPDDVDGKKALRKELKSVVAEISELQRKMYADKRFALLLVFQAMDAAGKDGTIRAVMSGVNPAGCHVSSFKAPSSEELGHDFLWRTVCKLPERGIIGIFNRSYYEEVLAVKVQPEFLAAQNLPPESVQTKNFDIWEQRYQSIVDHEEHLAHNGTIVLKFWLNVSRDEQKRRFLERLTNPDRYWKFSKSDLSVRSRWHDYMGAYEQLLSKTSTAHAPWYAIPADSKPWMRLVVARLIRDQLAGLPLAYPEKSADEIKQFGKYTEQLQAD